MRLIDADRIVYSWIIDADGEEHDGVALQSIIHKMPTIDAVEVVRCRDCKHYGRADMRRFYRGMDCLEGHIDTIVPDKDFCSYGERKDGEQECMTKI